MNDRESQIINKFFLPLAKNKESFGLSSDAALLNNNLVVSSDMIIESKSLRSRCYGFKTIWLYFKCSYS